MVGLPLLVKRPPGEIPPPYRDVMEPQRPLPADVEFIKQEGHVSLGGAWAMALLLGAFGLLMVGALPFDLWKELHKGPPNVWQIVLWGVLLVLGSVLLYGAVRRVRGEQALAAEQERKDFRYGLFLFSDALLIRLHGEPCTLVPRARIERVRTLDQMQGGAWIVLHVHTDSGNEQQLTIPGSLGSLMAARARLTSWLAKS